MESVLRAVGQAASRAADHIEKNSSDPRNDRTEIGAPKIETGYYSSGKMQGFGSDGRTYRPDAPAGGSYSSRMPGYGREDDTRGRGWREERRDYGRGYGGGSSSDYDRGPPRVDAEQMPTARSGVAIAASINSRMPGRGSAVVTSFL